jgi:hypothetical protein
VLPCCIFRSVHTERPIWDGTKWADQRPASPRGLFSDLVGVSCVATEQCEAVGYGTPGGGEVTFIDGMGRAARRPGSCNPGRPRLAPWSCRPCPAQAPRSVKP